MINSQNKSYKYPFLFLTLYISCLLATVCLANRLSLVNNLLLPGGIFSFIFTFAICDIVGEVYGYAYPRLFIWAGVISEFIFVFFVILISHLPTPQFFNHSDAYQNVFDPTFRYVVSSLIALLVGEFANIYLLAKWKILLRGNFFIFRSLISTAFGQACLTIIADLLNYSGKMATSDLLWLMVSGYTWKMCFAVILIIPSWIVVKLLKQAEKVDYYDIHTNFNPFILSLGDTSLNSIPIEASEIKIAS